MIPPKFRPLVIIGLSILVISDFYYGRYILGTITLIVGVLLTGAYIYLYRNEKKEKEINEE